MKDRVKEPVCRNCTWWYEKQHYLGDCTRFPPNIGAARGKTGSFLTTGIGDYCGEWKERE